MTQSKTPPTPKELVSDLLQHNRGVVLGEVHGYDNNYGLLTHNMADFKKDGLKQVFIELDPTRGKHDRQAAVEYYLSLDDKEAAKVRKELFRDHPKDAASFYEQRLNNFTPLYPEVAFDSDATMHRLMERLPKTIAPYAHDTGNIQGFERETGTESTPDTKSAGKLRHAVEERVRDAYQDIKHVRHTPGQPTERHRHTTAETTKTSQPQPHNPEHEKHMAALRSMCGFDGHTVTAPQQMFDVIEAARKTGGIQVYLMDDDPGRGPGRNPDRVERSNPIWEKIIKKHEHELGKDGKRIVLGGAAHLCDARGQNPAHGIDDRLGDPSVLLTVGNNTTRTNHGAGAGQPDYIAFIPVAPHQTDHRVALLLEAGSAMASDLKQHHPDVLAAWHKDKKHLTDDQKKIMNEAAYEALFQRYFVHAEGHQGCRDNKPRSFESAFLPGYPEQDTHMLEARQLILNEHKKGIQAECHLNPGLLAPHRYALEEQRSHDHMKDILGGITLPDAFAKVKLGSTDHPPATPAHVLSVPKAPATVHR